MSKKNKIFKKNDPEYVQNLILIFLQQENIPVRQIINDWFRKFDELQQNITKGITKMHTF